MAMPPAPVPEELDLRGVVCPINYAKILIRLNALPPGGRLAVVIDDGLPIKFVPHSAVQDGHRVLDSVRLDSGHWRLVIERAASSPPPPVRDAS